jgi:hypothetical protein
MVMMLFSVCVALIFGTVARDSDRAKLIYGVKIFAQFMGVGLALAWLLYFLPF